MDWRWIDDIADAAGIADACAFVTADDGAAGRLNRHAALVAAMLGCDPRLVAISRNDSGAPVLLRPTQALSLSRAARDDLTVLAAAPCPIGVDLERIEPGREPAWNVLSGSERAALQALPEPEWPQAFARLWSAKEAYLKALRVGLRREPASFSVVHDATRFTIHDPEHPKQKCLGVHTTHESGERRYVLAGVLLPAG